MRWHAERVKPDDGDEPKLRHLADASQWRELNAEFDFVANDPEIDKKDNMLSHPKDASQWQALNFEYPEFGNDPRNIVLGTSSDGMNPFGNQNTNHSTWPVFVWMYNLPPGCA